MSVPHWIEDVRKYAGSNIVQLLIGELGVEAGGAWSQPYLCLSLSSFLSLPREGLSWDREGAGS